MNVIVANKCQNEISNLEIDIIKSISGVYSAEEIVEMFKNFFYNKMILDVTALKSFDDVQTYEILKDGLDVERIIFLLPEKTKLCTPNFLGQLITIGIYNFTTSIKGVKYLVKKANTIKDVEHILKMSKAYQMGSNRIDLDSDEVDSYNDDSSLRKESIILGFRNLTEHAGATTLIYMLIKELAYNFGKSNVIGVELNKTDFSYIKDKRLQSIKDIEIKEFLSKFSGVNVILVDLNDCKDASFCNDVIYLIEPTTIKLNKLISRKKDVFTKLGKKKVILNKSALLSNDVSDFEKEAGIKVFYNMPSLDERKRNSIIGDFLNKLGVISTQGDSNSNKIFGLFRK